MNKTIIPARFCGPPNIGHGSYVAALLADGVLGARAEAVQVTLRKDQPKRAAETKRALRRAAALELPEPAATLFEALRAERSRLAKAQGVPPYVIFHDATLRAMALMRPRSTTEMGELAGIGEAKLNRYGKTFLEVIRTAV